jgi:hypothetical protein
MTFVGRFAGATGGGDFICERFRKITTTILANTGMTKNEKNTIPTIKMAVTDGSAASIGSKCIFILQLTEGNSAEGYRVFMICW